MKANPDLILRKIGRQYMIVSAATGDVNMTDVFTLNESAAILWQYAVGRDFTAADLAACLCDVYAIAPDVARRDVDHILDVWTDYGLIAP